MAIKAVLFDLDGTLLPMDQDRFLKGYFGLLTKTMAENGYDGQIFMKALMAGTAAMVKNDGTKTNEAAFWQVFHGFYSPEEHVPLTLFDRFYEEVFPRTRAFCGDDPRPRQIVNVVHRKGLCCALATAPAFPAIATETRMAYVGLSPSDFALVTSYENCTTCKPNPTYYQDVAKRVGFSPEECLMVGNDVTDDMIPAREVGMQVFLLTDFLINKIDADISVYPNGGYDALLAYINSL